MQLLRGQFVNHAWTPLAACLAGRRELGAGAISPGAGVQAVECIHGGVELLTGQNPVSGSPQPLSVRQLRARRLERIGRLLVEAERLLKVQGEVGVFGEQPTATERAGERPWLPFGSRSGRELCGGPLRVVVTA